MSTRISHLRREILVDKSLTYLTVGIFLLAYVNDVKDVYLVFSVAIALCLWSFIVLFVANLFPKLSRKIFSFNIDAFLVPITFASLFIGVATTADKSYLFLRFVLPFGWIIFRYFFDIIEIFKMFRAKINIRNITKNRSYRLLVILEYLSIGMGFCLLLNQVMNPETALALLEINKWIYNSLLWFAISIILVIPVICLTPQTEDETPNI
jgi:hypothetical protein